MRINELRWPSATQLAACAAAILLPLAIAKVVANIVAAAPSANLSTTSIEATALAPASLTAMPLTISNRGKSPLTFSVATSCTCSDVSPAAGVLQPGGSTEIVASIRAAVTPGAVVRSQLTITTNDPHLRSASVSLTLTTPVLITSSRSQLEFGETLQAILHSPQEISFHSELSPDRKITARSRKGTCTLTDRGNGTYLVSPTASNNPGNVYDAIEVLFDGEHAPELVIPVHFSVSAPLSCSPRRIMIRPSADGTYPTQTIVFKSHAAIGSLNIVPAIPAVALAKVSSLGPKVWSCKLSFNPSDTFPPHVEVMDPTTGASCIIGLSTHP